MAHIIAELRRKHSIQKARRIQQQEQESLAISKPHSPPKEQISAIQGLHFPPSLPQPDTKAERLPSTSQQSVKRKAPSPLKQQQQQGKPAPPQHHHDPAERKRLSSIPEQQEMEMKTSSSMKQERPAAKQQQLQYRSPHHQQQAPRVQRLASTSQEKEIPAPTKASSSMKQQQGHPAIQKLTYLPQQPFQPSKKIYVVHDKVYVVQEYLGKGASCKVYEVKRNNDVFAIKVVDLEDLDSRTVQGFLDEVELLEKLRGKEGIIQLEDFEVKEDEHGNKRLLIVMEKGENDFQTFLRSTNKSRNLTRYYWECMLQCVKVIHENKIVHSDLKPANFIFVKNQLKLIDFGIASAIPSDLTSIPKDAQSGTLNYMSPESVKHRDDYKVHIPLAADIWSLGCILYSMVYNTLPWSHIPEKDKKFDAIQNLDVQFPPVDDEHLLNVMQQCLQRDYRKRPTAAELLGHPYLQPNSTNNTNTNSGLSCFGSSKNELVAENSELVGRIVKEAQNNTPKTAAKKITSILQTQPNIN